MAAEREIDPLTQMLWAMGSGILAGNNGQPFSSVLGKGMYAGMEGYNNAVQSRRKGKMADLEAEKSQLEIGEYKRKLKDQEALAEAYRAAAAGGAAPSGESFAPGTRPSMAFTPEANAGLPPAPTTPPQQSGGGAGKEAVKRRLQATIDNLIAKGAGHMVGPLQDQLAKLDPEITSVREGLRNGQRVTIKQFKDGTEQVSAFDPEGEKLHFIDQGGSVQGVSPTTARPAGPAMTKTLTPGETASNSLGWFNAQKPTLQDTGSGFAAVSTPRGGGLSVTGVPGLTSPKAREDADNLRKEFNSLGQVKNYTDIAPIYNAAAKAPDTPAGDFALIYGVGKILDPGSVVREGEMNMVMAAGSPAQRVMGYLNYLKGNGRLTPPQRAELTEMLHNAASERQTSYQQARGTFSNLATQRGYKPEDVFIGSPEVVARPAPAAPPPEQRKLGQVYSTPQGNMKWMGNGWLPS